MSLDNVSPGDKVPEAFNVIIEIPMNGDPIKYEVDKESGAIFVDRFMNTAMHYPTNYGYVPKTIAGDGDPVDVRVVTPVPLMPGVVVPCRAGRSVAGRAHRPGLGEGGAAGAAPELVRRHGPMVGRLPFGHARDATVDHAHQGPRPAPSRRGGRPRARSRGAISGRARRGCPRRWRPPRG